jgi:TRAP-type C4-dicarboxylate transport system permease small subunit
VTRLLRLYDGLIGALAWVAGVAVVAIFALIVIDVASRELLGSSLTHTIAVVEYLMLYFTMFAAPFLVRTRGHVYIEAVITRLPRRAQRALEKFVYIVCALASAIFGTIAMMLLIEKLETATIDIRGIDIPSWVIVAPMPVCYGLVAIEFLRFLFGRDSLYGQGGAAPDAL